MFLLWPKTRADLKAHRSQFLAVWLVVVLGTLFYGATYPSAVNMQASFYRTYEQLHYMDYKIQLSGVSQQPLDERPVVPKIGDVQGRLVTDALVQSPQVPSLQATLRLISLAPGEARINQPVIVGGRAIRDAGEVVVLQRFADRVLLHLDDKLDVKIVGESYSLRIVGFAFNPEYIVAGRSPMMLFPTPSSFGVAWLSYADLSGMMAREGEYNELIVRGPRIDDQVVIPNKDAIQQWIKEEFPEARDVGIIANSETPSGEVVTAQIRGIFPILRFFSIMFLAGATLITAVLLGRFVESERMRIGLLRAMGLSRQEIVSHYLVFGFLIGLTGGLVGTILGYLASFGTMYAYVATIVGGTMPGFMNSPQWNFLALGLAVVVLSSTLAGAVPAWIESGAPPGITLRPSVPLQLNALSRLEFAPLPLAFRQALRNLLRVPGRSIGTALGTAIGATMIFSALAIWDMIDNSFDQLYATSDFDVRVEFGTLQTTDAIEQRLRDLPGVRESQAALLAPAAVLQEGTSYDATLVAVFETQSFLSPVTLGGQDAFAGADGVWVGHNMARTLGLFPAPANAPWDFTRWISPPLDKSLEPGSEPAITVRAFDQQRTVKVLGVVSQALGNTIFVPYTLLRQFTPSGMVPGNCAFVRLDPGTTPQFMAAATKFADVTTLLSIPEFVIDTDNYLLFFRISTLICGVFGLVLTLVILLNAVNASMLERHRELTILRSMGTTGAETAISVSLEQLVMVAAGALIGVPVGYEIGFWLGHTWDSQLFGMLEHYSPQSTLIGLVGLVGVVLVAQVHGLRAVTRADLGQVSKSLSY